MNLPVINYCTTSNNFMEINSILVVLLYPGIQFIIEIRNYFYDVLSSGESSSIVAALPSLPNILLIEVIFKFFVNHNYSL